MDPMTPAQTNPAASATSRHNTWFLPEAAPLAMPEQPLRNHAAPTPYLESSPARVRVRRAFLLLFTFALTAVAAEQMYLVLNVNGLTPLEAVVLGLYVMLFAWIAFSFATSLIGSIVIWSRSRPLGIDLRKQRPELSTRTAILVPTYNEAPDRLMARVQAVYESVVEIGAVAYFDFFILSDTTNPEIWIAEEAAFLTLRDRTRGHERIFYRHRANNVARKAGNIAEWVRRFGGRYPQMLVLDADSLMTGDTIVHLVAAMESHPNVGLIQTLPMIVNATTPFARVQQFAGRVYGPLIAYGLAWWHGAEANYWGHNAVLRTQAFADHAGLPLLSGRKPFGGHILSHDFVEAALMRRGGVAIHLAPGLPGSYEEVPPSLNEYAQRDRRWCQGNLQHLAVLGTSGLHWVSRLHLLTGMGAYLTAPMWLVFLVVGIAISLQAQFIRPEYFPSGFALFPQWPAEDPERAIWVFVATMALLTTPKLFGYLVLMTDGTVRRGCGGGLGALLSVILETVLSGLIAPVMMLSQSIGIGQILLGDDAGWRVQRRDDGTTPFRGVAHQYAGHTIFGLLLAGAAYAVSLPLFLWMSPVVLGLVLAIPLAVLTSQPSVGRAWRRLGLLLTPEEGTMPRILARANALTAAAGDTAAVEACTRLLDDPALVDAHWAMLPEAARQRGEVNVALVVGLAKLEEAGDLAEAVQWLSAQEKNALLSDRRGIERLIDLKQHGREGLAPREDGLRSTKDDKRPR
jgi:membrane glycosyltransferase